jgi:hypothetical protein
MNAILRSVLVLALGALTATEAQSQAEIEMLMAQVSDRVADFYNRAKSVVCIETSRVQNLDAFSAPVGFVRTVESELRIEQSDQAAGEATFVRTVRKVNGRAVRENDRRERDGCTDPNPLSSEPLAFVLPARRAEYEFKFAGSGTDRNRRALIIAFSSVNRRSNPELIEDPGGHENCFDWTGHIASSGRMWVDAANYDVLRVDRRLRGPVDVKVPTLIQRRHQLDPFVVIVREDVTMRYQTVKFSDPDEVLLLPDAIESFMVIRGGLQSTRRSQTFSDYRRFVAEGKVLP